MAKPISNAVVDAAVRQALESRAVRRAMRDRAARVLPRAQRLAYQAGAVEFGDALRMDELIRPGAKSEGGLRRPTARVGAVVTEDMRAADAGATLTRRQILTRASRA